MQRSVIIGSIWFQLIWFMAVLGRETLIWPLLILVVATYIWSWRNRVISFELVALLGMGLTVDFIHVRVGVFQFEGGSLMGLPSWLVLLWCMFAWYAVMMKPVIQKVKPVIVVIFGAAGGTLSYIAGARFGAVELPWGIWHSSLALAAAWTVLSTIIVSINQIQLRSNRQSTAYKENKLI
ncbi:hypothetical protein ST37_13790 [Vibrio sp. qd031]|uniref:DUF2878 domain-containing protein n=1 Tax=Vibrio sp. qd031 TaxID=1603038 RepID=UPI000A119B81|nr:DUF2878 domain-containing protein [Vibrio sp. qd031]ORT49467.1 hypothetical protein ST37_13790 [Vibrio sp. qd031]